MKKFNLNQNVYFKLNNKGKEILKNHWRGEYVKEDENGFYCMQAWLFLDTFGSYFYIGQLPVIDGNNIYFDENDLI